VQDPFLHAADYWDRDQRGQRKQSRLWTCSDTIL